MIFSNNIYKHIEHFGLSITPSAVRLVSTDKSGKIRQQLESTSPKPFIEGDIVDRESLSKALSELMRQIGSTTVYSAVCFPEKLAYSREHVLPKISIQEISEAVRWQLPTIFPLNPEDIYYDWKLLFQSDQETKIVVTAVSKLLLDGIRESCQLAGIKPISFESSAGALARAIKTLPPKAIIAEIDSFGSTSTLVENGVSSITTTTSFSGTTDSTTALQDIALSVHKLLDRLHPDTAANPSPLVYITGEKSSAKLAQILSTQIGQKVVELSLDQIPAIYHIAYIESITSIESPESEKTINLLPEQLQRIYRGEAELTHAKKTAIIGLVIGSIACLVSFGVFLTISLMSQQAVTKLASIVNPPPPPADINLPLFMQKAQKITTLQPAKKTPITPLADAISIVEKLPLRQFDYSASAKTIRVSLTSIGRETLFEIKDLFETSGEFQPVAIPLSALGSEVAEAVSLIIQIKDK